MNARIFKRSHKQKAVYWGTPVNTGSGYYTYDSPVEINVRWEDRQEKFTDQNGEEQLSRAVVFLSQDVDIQGQLSLMQLINLSSTERPEDNSGWEIKAFRKIPDFKGQNYERKVWL